MRGYVWKTGDPPLSFADMKKAAIENLKFSINAPLPPPYKRIYSKEQVRPFDDVIGCTCGEYGHDLDEVLDQQYEAGMKAAVALILGSFPEEGVVAEVVKLLRTPPKEGLR